MALLFALAVRAGEKRVLTGQRPEVVAHLQPVGDVPATTRMNLAIGLPLRNRLSLSDLLHQLYDPGSPNFHRYLTTEQFTELFAPTERDYQSVSDYMAKEGLSVTRRHSNRLLLDVSGSAEDVERVFQIKMRVYQHPLETRTFFAPDVDPSIAATLPVLDISGLDNYLTPRSMCLKAGTNAAINPTPATGSGPRGNYIGNDLRAAYVPNVSLDGTGQAVGLFELEGYYTNDITNYEHLTGLPNVSLTNVLIDGFNGTPDTNVNFITEVSLDIEMAISMAPRLTNVMVYEASSVNLTFAIIDDVLNQMATDNLAKQLSSSWTWGGATNATVDDIFLEYATQGQSFYQACGDGGAYTGKIDEPADDPYITIVGGTTLTTSRAGGSWVSEEVWSWFPSEQNATGGGVSTNFGIPSWQQPVSMTANMGSATNRNIPDVALTANNIWIIFNNGESNNVGGTSCAAPLWAGFTALVNQHAAAHGQATVGFINPAVYAIGQGTNYTSDFHDITTGNNTNRNSPSKYFAVTGYDLCTGWGTPNGAAMIDALVPGLSPITPTVAWTNPAAIVYGAALSATHLNATANVPGTFAYDPADGVVLTTGTDVLSLVFTPDDTFDYNSVTTSVTQVVMPAQLTVTANNAVKVYGESNPVFTASYGGFVNGESTNVLSGSPSLSTTATTFSSVAGSPYEIVAAAGTLSATNYTFAFSDGQLTVNAANPADAVSSSANPAPIGSNVVFTAALTAVSPGSGIPTGTVQFYADGAPLGSPVALTGGLASISVSSLSQGLHSISNQYLGDGNFLAGGGALSPEESINPSLVAANVVLQRNQNCGVKVLVANLLTNDTAPEGETLTLFSADPTSTNGGSVVESNSWLFYTPLPGLTNSDAFSYVIADSGGAQAAGLVSITVPIDLSQSQNIVGIETLTNNASLISFQGIAGRAYTVQYTESLQTPAWQTLGTSMADATGAFEYTDSPTNGSPARFYRSTYP